MLYAAYGSNLCHAQMDKRCRAARAVGALLLPGWILRLGRFARIEPAGAEEAVPIGIWRVTEDCLAALDVSEGTAAGTYERVRQELPRPVDGATEAWIYLERILRPPPPKPGYAARIRRGYADFGFSDTGPLDRALAAIGAAAD